MSSESFIPLCIPNIKENELVYVTEAVSSGWISTGGGQVKDFEKKFAEYLGLEDACACQSGTAGLHLCLVHFGVEANDIVLVPTLTFIATINPIIYQKAVPVFFDCTEHLGIDSKQIQKYIEEQCFFDGKVLREKSTGRLVKAIIPVHIFGDICPMDELMDLASKYNLVVIEDATESLGSKVAEGKYKGFQSGTIGHAGVFSFNANKIITTGGGGMIVSRDKALVNHTRYLSQQAKDDDVYFVHNEVGFNYRMTNLQAALGLGQLELLDEFIAIKQANFELYKNKLKGNILGDLLEFQTGNISNKWFYSFVLKKEYEYLRNNIIDFLGSENIQVRPIWKLNHLQKPFSDYPKMSFERAEEFYVRIINLPCSTSLTEAEIEKVVRVLNEFLIPK